MHNAQSHNVAIIIIIDQKRSYNGEKEEPTYFDKFIALYPTQPIDLFQALAPVRANSNMLVLSSWIEHSKPPSRPRHAIIIQFIGTGSEEVDSDEVIFPDIVLPRLLVDYGDRKKVPELAPHQSASIVKWMKNFRHDMY